MGLPSAEPREFPEVGVSAENVRRDKKEPTEGDSARQTGVQGLPNMHRGFLANFSRPRQPLYRQQHPAAQTLKANSAPKTKIANVSCVEDE